MLIGLFMRVGHSSGLQPQRNLVLLFVLCTLCSRAAIVYVDSNSTQPLAPYTNWQTAAHVIQDAIDAAAPGDQVLVSNGLYQTGGRNIFFTQTNRVAITKPIVVQSVNGPLVTVIQGYQDPGVTNGLNAVRCAYLTNGAVLSGFTLTNGATQSLYGSGGGGAWCESVGAVITNCVVVANASVTSGGGVYSGSLYDCLLAGNVANYGSGGGAFGGSSSNCVLVHCTLANNIAAFEGGGAAACELTDCSLTENGAQDGGGVSDANLLRCSLTNNWSRRWGGGTVSIANLTNCMLVGNWSSVDGGGARGPGTVLFNCTLLDNWAYNSGGGAVSCTLEHCLLAGNNANTGGGASAGTLENCLLTNNWAGSGGGTYNALVNNCVLGGNSAYWGGGAFGGTLNNCLLTNNSGGYGGGAAQDDYFTAVLNNCTVVGNTANEGAGGGYLVSLNNCIVYSNTAPADPNYTSINLNYCCTLPLPTAGSGNITNNPLFVNASVGDLRLQSNSPCIDAGSGVYVTTSTDLAGNPRISGGAVDIGAYEFQAIPLTPFQIWLSSYGLPIDGSADYTDPDGDGMNNWQEWRCGTDPTNPLSVLRITSLRRTESGCTLTWQSVTNRTYFIQRGFALPTAGVFNIFVRNITGQPGITCYTDTNSVGFETLFYRVGVQ